MDPFKFEDNFADVIFAGLTTRGIPHGTLRGDAELPQERVEVVPSGFQRASPQMAKSNSNVWFHSHYSGQIAFGIITQVGGNNAANHNVWLSSVRTLMDRSSQFFTANNLPCYNVLKIAEDGSDPDQKPPTDAHHTQITYVVEVGIIGSQVA